VFKTWKDNVESLSLGFVAYFTWAAVAILGVFNMDPGMGRVWAVVLLILFGIGMAFQPDPDDRERNKHLYFVLQNGLITALIILDPAWGVYQILFFVLSSQAMMVFPRESGLLWIGIFTLSTGGVLVANLGWKLGIITLWPYFAGYLFFGIFALAMQQARVERDKNKELLKELRETHQQLKEYSDRVEELTITKERNRLAREMHDTLGHRLTVASVQLEGASKLIGEDPQKSRQIVETARDQVRKALQELRNTVATMREPLQVDLPLEKALQELILSFEKALDLEVHLMMADDLPDLSKHHRLPIYRIAQEALTNVQKHARADQVWIQLFVQGPSLILLISDDGRGYPEEIPEHAFGIAGIRERVHHLGGTLELGERKGGGARMRVEFPWEEV
jgi:signal transduction histidine kinase